MSKKKRNQLVWVPLPGTIRTKTPLAIKVETEDGKDYWIRKRDITALWHRNGKRTVVPCRGVRLRAIQIPRRVRDELGLR